MTRITDEMREASGIFKTNDRLVTLEDVKASHMQFKRKPHYWLGVHVVNRMTATLRAENLRLDAIAFDRAQLKGGTLRIIFGSSVIRNALAASTVSDLFEPMVGWFDFDVSAISFNRIIEYRKFYDETAVEIEILSRKIFSKSGDIALDSMVNGKRIIELLTYLDEQFDRLIVGAR